MQGRDPYLACPFLKPLFQTTSRVTILTEQGLYLLHPDENTETDRPTLFYFHGGGFFGGSKNMGDPMAANEATALLDDLCAQG